MGLLVAKKYPTTLFLKAADHTYVECGNGGKAWAQIKVSEQHI